MTVLAMQAPEAITDTKSITKAIRRKKFLPPLLVRRIEAARLCSLSPASWDRQVAAGNTPAPIKIGGSVLWSISELRAWSEHGCPSRAEWGPIWLSIVANRRTRKK